MLKFGKPQRPKPQIPKMQAPAPSQPNTPWSAPLQTSLSANQTAFDNTNLGLNQQEQNTQQQFGLDTGYNDVAQNPYSRAALLSQSYRQGQRGTLSSMASAGQGYSGITSSRLATGTDQYNQGYNALRQEQTGALQAIAERRLAAQSQLAQDNAGAEWDAVGSALKTEPDSSAYAVIGRRRQQKQRHQQQHPQVHNPPKKGKK